VWSSLTILGRGRQVSTLSSSRRVRRAKYTHEQLRDAVSASTSFRQVLIRLNVAPFGGNYGVLRRAIQKHCIDTSHFVGRSWSRGRILSMRKPLESYLHLSSSIHSYKLKRRLLRAGVLEPLCVGCGLKKWLDSPIPLELDHINGNNRDNRLENLRLLCPNCHALTPTYRSRRRPKLSSVLQPPWRAAVPPTLTPFTGPFPIPVLNCLSPLRLPFSPPGLRVPAWFYTAAPAGATPCVCRLLRSSPTQVC